MASLFEHGLDVQQEEVHQVGMGLATVANTLEPMLLKFKQDFSSIGENVIKRIKNQVGRGRASVKKHKAVAKKVSSRKPQVGGGKGKSSAKKSLKKTVQVGRGKKPPAVKKNSSKKKKLQANF